MNHFSENLSQLRRRAGYTQETLAEAVGVSRQAVSKWESGLAMPEAATLIELADVLGCTLDQLMREEPRPAGEGPFLPPEYPRPDAGMAGEEEYQGPREEDWLLFQAYEAHMARFSLAMAAGVGLILLGVAGMLWSCAFWNDDTFVVIPLFGALACAVFLFVSQGISHDEFQKAYPFVLDMRDMEEVRREDQVFGVGIALAVAGILADVALMVALMGPAKYLWGTAAKAAETGSVALFMAVLGVCVGTLVYLGIRHSRYEEFRKGPKRNG